MSNRESSRGEARRLGIPLLPGLSGCPECGGSGSDDEDDPCFVCIDRDAIDRWCEMLRIVREAYR